jgi:hypothetical protein
VVHDDRYETRDGSEKLVTTFRKVSSSNCSRIADLSKLLSQKPRPRQQFLGVFEVLNKHDFILSIQQSNSKIGKTKKLLTRELGNPTGEEK